MTQPTSDPNHPVTAAEAHIAITATVAERLACKRRRLLATFVDLGLDRSIPRSVATIGDDGLELRLTARQAETLIQVLEDLGADRHPTPTTPGPDQLELPLDSLFVLP